jgi:hypothetical protein
MLSIVDARDDRARRHERVAALRTERTRAERDLAAARDGLERLDQAMERVQYASQRFDAALARVYRELTAARSSFAHTSADIGAERAAAALSSAEFDSYGRTLSLRRYCGAPQRATSCQSPSNTRVRWGRSQRASSRPPAHTGLGDRWPRPPARRGHRHG